MGHHLTEDGKFQSDKFPDLPEGYVAVKIGPKTWLGLRLIAKKYEESKPEFSADLVAALETDTLEWLNMPGGQRSRAEE